MSTSIRGNLWIRPLAVGSTLVLGATLVAGGTAAAAPEPTATVYAVTQEGLTFDGGAALAEAFRVENALTASGAFSYADSAKLAMVPTVPASGQGRDENGRPTVAEALDTAALGTLKPVPDEVALARGQQLVGLAGLSADLTAEPVVSHAELTLVDKAGGQERTQPIDTSVTYKFRLGGLPAEGQGAKLRLTVAPDGTVTQLSHSLRKLARAGEVPVISVEQAQQQCAALYGPDVRQNAPTLGYQLPALTSTQADGRGTVKTIFPQYTCNPVAQSGALAHRLLPAVVNSAPTAKITVSRSGEVVNGSATVSGGTGPYTYQWSSSSTTLAPDTAAGTSVSYRRQPRDSTTAAGPEQVTLEVTDANGVTSTASVTLAGDGTGSASSTPGGGGYGPLEVAEAGIEQTVDWACAQASGDGFRKVMKDHGVAINFDWRLGSAFEIDFKSQGLGGWDHLYTDDVDDVWYTGHGGPGIFTFTSNVTDHSIVPADARWGDRDLEWLQLESCQVLANPGQWVPSFTGLHQLNGFVTNAYCIAGGTGGTFASYLFPLKFLWWTLRPAFPVRTAWAAMAADKEPSGVKYRTMGLIGPGGVTDINDYFWFQGPTGVDIAPGTAIGYWYVTGTV